MTGRVTIGLYNSYDKLRFAEAHRRAACRAGALAWAFEANLATFGFPYDEADVEAETPKELAAWLADSTTIGDDGDALRSLADAGRFDVFELPDPGFPPQVGRVVLATRRPDPDKARSVPDVAGSLAQGESQCLVFGLGPRGVPGDLRDVADAHLDVTGQGRVLETATAMGAVVAAVHWVHRVRQSGSR